MVTPRDPALPARLLGGTLGLLILWPLLHFSDFRPWVAFEPGQLAVTGQFLSTFMPPAHDLPFLSQLLVDTLRTLAMATVGMTLALVLAVPLALSATHVLSRSARDGAMARGPFWWRQGVRGVLIVLRSVPELVWALVFVRVVGLGPTAGVLAIALTYAGMLGKVYAEILESGDTHPVRALQHQGAGRLQVLLWALLPLRSAELTSYTVYRWECAVRSSVVLGFVGAGGLGQSLDQAMKMFDGGAVVTILAVFVLLVAAADRLSAWLRSPLGNRPGAGLLVVPGLAAGVCASFWLLDLQGSALLSVQALADMGRFLGSFFPPQADAAFVQAVVQATAQTFAMSAVGTLLAAVCGMALALLGGPLLRGLANVLRAIPELAWAGLLLIAVGLGPLAGTLALALHTGGVLGRLFAEALENVPDGPAAALRAQGVGRTQVFLVAVLPQVLPQWLGYTLYRWENNIRAATVLGVVGAGGLGQMLTYHLSLFHMTRSATVLLAMVVLVVAVDAASQWVRLVGLEGGRR